VVPSQKQARNIFKLWPWQETAVGQAHAPSLFIIYEPRLGKTAAVVDSIRNIVLEQRTWDPEPISKFLIVSPPLAGITVWPDTFRERFPTANVLMLIGGSIKKRIADFEQWRSQYQGEVQIVIVNYEAVAKMKAAFIKWNPYGLVLDEVHLVKRAGAQRSRALTAIADRCRWRRGLTGTPVPNNYADIYSQYRIIAPFVFGTRQKDFRDRYIIYHPHWRNKVVGYQHLEELQQRMLSVALVKKRIDAFGPTQIQRVIQPIPLTGTGKRIYDKLAKDYIIEIEGDKKIPMTHKMSRLSTLQQIASGFYYEGDEVKWVHDAKINALMEEMSDYFGQGKPIVVFYRFDAEGERIEQEFRKAAPNNGVVRISGNDQDVDRRRETLEKFGTPDGPKYLILQEQVGSLGIGLARASACIFFSLSFNYATHTQARDRIWKPGDEPLVYIYLETQRTVDGFARRVVEGKESAEHNLLTEGAFEKAVYGAE
jgi:SNF2 family DNA or RNA helicase